MNSKAQETKDQVWEEVIDTLEKIAVMNSGIKDEIKKIADTAQNQMEFSIKVLNAISAKYPDVAKKYHLDKVRIKAFKSLDFIESPKLQNFVSNRLEVLELFTNYRDEFMKSTRVFADIVIDGPQNKQEEVVLNTAKCLLEPHAFMDTIRSRDTVSGALKRIDSSVLKKLNLQMFVVYHMMLVQKQLNKDTQVMRIEGVLSKEFNVTENLVKALSKPELGKPSLAKIIEEQKQQRGQGGPGFGL